MPLREAGELARLLQALGDQAARGGVGVAHAAAASVLLCSIRRSQTKIAISSMERGSLVTSSIKMFTSFGIEASISIARMVVATGQILLSNFGMVSTGLMAPVSGGHSRPLSA